MKFPFFKFMRFSGDKDFKLYRFVGEFKGEIEFDMIATLNPDSRFYGIRFYKEPMTMSKRQIDRDGYDEDWTSERKMYRKVFEALFEAKIKF